MDPDRLAQLALGEPADEAADDATNDGHLDSCPRCRADLDALRNTVTMVRESNIRPHDITLPPERVWRGITAELSLEADVPPQSAPEQNVVALRRRRRWQLAAVAAVAGLLGVGGTLVATQLVDDDGGGGSPVKQVALAPLPTGPQDVSGQATVAVAGDATQIRVNTNGLTEPDGAFYEVWVINPDDLTSMHSLGALGPRADGRFMVPPNVDLGRYSVVDVSIEPVDGDPTHSSRSVLRGTLPTA